MNLIIVISIIIIFSIFIFINLIKKRRRTTYIEAGKKWDEIVKELSRRK